MIKLLKNYCLVILVILFPLSTILGYERIVSLAPSITEELYLLDNGDKIIGVTTFCNYPKEAKQKEKIGTLVEPNIEKIVSLKPDLVLAASINPAVVIQKLKQLKVNVIQLKRENSFEDICDNFIEIGKLTGKEKFAKKIVEKNMQNITAIKNKTKSLNRPKIFLQCGANPLVTVGRNTFEDEIIYLAGGINIANKNGSGYFRYSSEEVLKQNPDIIVIETMGIATKEEIKSWNRYKNLKAVKENRIYTIDGDILCRPVPTRFIEGLKKISELIQK